MAIQDQISQLPLEDDFPTASTRGPATPAVVFPLYTKQWWLETFGPGTGFRKWFNGTRDRQTFEMRLELPRWLDEKDIKPSDRCVRVLIEPGETLELPKIWDRGIRTVNDGVVCGGMAPRLTPVGAAYAPFAEGIAHLDKGPLEESKP